MPKDQTVYEIDLHVTPEDRGVYIRSKDVPGLHLCGSNLRAMKPIVEKAIKRLFLDNKGLHVNVVWVAAASELPRRQKAEPTRVAVYKELQAA